MKKADAKTDGDRMTLTADLRDYPGKIYAFLPVPIKAVSLQCTRRSAGGKNIDYRVAVADEKGQPINASFPLEITLTDPAGAIVQQINRAAAPKFTGVYRLAANAAAGSGNCGARADQRHCQ